VIVLFKNTIKLFSLFLLLLLSFIYTDKVFNEARGNDPLMKEVISYKKAHDVKPVEPKIKDDEMILGMSGLIINEEKSYKNMKEDDTFNKQKLVYDKKNPNTSITKTYDYYITNGISKNMVSIIFKVNNSTNVSELLSILAKTNVTVNFFIDGSYLEKNVETAFSMVNLNSEIYNLGYDNKYSKSMISVTNNLIESITLKDSLFCLNEVKNDNYKDICASKKMLTISPKLVNPNITDLKKNLSKGVMIVYDLDEFDTSKFNFIINVIESRGYKIKGLSKLINENS
jgi:hypothetical protein